MMILNRGRLVAQGTPAELRQGKASLEDAYVALIGEDAP